MLRAMPLTAVRAHTTTTLFAAVTAKSRFPAYGPDEVVSSDISDFVTVVPETAIKIPAK